MRQKGLWKPPTIRTSFLNHWICLHFNPLGNLRRISKRLRKELIFWLTMLEQVPMVKPWARTAYFYWCKPIITAISCSPICYWVGMMTHYTQYPDICICFNYFRLDQKNTKRPNNQRGVPNSQVHTIHTRFWHWQSRCFSSRKSVSGTGRLCPNQSLQHTLYQRAGGKT